MRAACIPPFAEPTFFREVAFCPVCGKKDDHDRGTFLGVTIVSCPEMPVGMIAPFRPLKVRLYLPDGTPKTPEEIVDG
jgi:hypothetical protein